MSQKAIFWTALSGTFPCGKGNLPHDVDVFLFTTLMLRRQFVCTATAAATLVRRRDVFAAGVKDDLIVKGGRVIDPSRKLNAIQ